MQAWGRLDHPQGQRVAPDSSALLTKSGEESVETALLSPPHPQATPRRRGHHSGGSARWSRVGRRGCWGRSPRELSTLEKVQVVARRTWQARLDAGETLAEQHAVYPLLLCSDPQWDRPTIKGELHVPGEDTIHPDNRFEWEKLGAKRRIVDVERFSRDYRNSHYRWSPGQSIRDMSYALRDILRFDHMRIIDQ